MTSCIEPFDASYADFESALVIDAVLTNEMKQQHIVLSRTYEFEEEVPSAESNATITVMDSNGNQYAFSDTGNGMYLSDQAFAAELGVEYQLFITTRDGRSYGSDPVPLTTGTTTIDQITVNRITNDFGEDGMAIFVDSFDPSGNSVNYRYDYEETFRVIAPDWNQTILVGDPQGGCNVVEEPNRIYERVCYPTVNSNRIIQTTTKDFDEDRVANFMVRFIDRSNYIISYRYSILVRQYVQSIGAYTFYRTLGDLSSSENLFSQIQTGFLQGNVFSTDNQNEQVLGYFDVASVDEKRIFFNYSDFYPDEPLPPYVQDCRPSTPVIANPGGCVLRPILESGTAVFVGDNASPADGEGPYLIAPIVCGDCSVLGTAEVPEFWTE
ncbi:DUF4249 domain-containing protein [Muricauda sp. CAU 1633]|uniref:DUF4249 domain-containing protein n=1 Tax=Allomuricauda sp. CAU 1633 TaxID=2816036 RepID=UPI001A8F4A20|nr:DUF4249 domain-containing protein [Muricauda sp. CAU 1633]MBO0323073.1 DUF4249 domain-containing protein [Muricauda sp. CAU 1633]